MTPFQTLMAWLDFFFSGALIWIVGGIIALIYLLVGISIVSDKLTYKFCDDETYYKWKRAMNRFEYTLNERNTKRVNEVLREILKFKHNIILEEDVRYHFEFHENTFGKNYYNITFAESYGEGKVGVKNVYIPATMRERLEVYKAW